MYSERARHLAGLLAELGERLRMSATFANGALMVGIELVRDRASRTPYDPAERIGVRVTREARSRGIILRPLGNVIILMPPLSITANELESLVRVTAESIEAATAS